MVTLQSLISYLQATVPGRVRQELGADQTPWQDVEGYRADDLVLVGSVTAPGVKTTVVAIKRSPDTTVLSEKIVATGVSAGEGSPATGTSDIATLIFFRPRRFSGELFSLPVYVDRRQVGKLRSGRYFTIAVSTGEHEIRSGLKDATPFKVSAHPGEHIYIEAIEVVRTPWLNGFHLIPVESKDGERSIKGLAPMKSSAIRPPLDGEPDDRER